MPSLSSPRGARVVCDTEKRIPPSSASTREITVLLPAPDGAETTTTTGSRSLNVLHLLAEALDLGLQPDHLADRLRVLRLAADRVGLAHQLLREEVELLARGGAAARDQLARRRHVAAQPLQLLAHVVALDGAHRLLVEPHVLEPQLGDEGPRPLQQRQRARLARRRPAR